MKINARKTPNKKDIENDQLVYTFMGWDFPEHKEGKLKYVASGSDILRYYGFNKSWNFLIPVCKKIDCLLENNLISNDNYEKYVQLCDELDHYVTLYELEPVYKQVVKIIKWYNKVNKLVFVNGN